ncbi:MAG: ROK family protein [Planctomycetota bacterium]|jgi:glucokinase
MMALGIDLGGTSIKTAVVDITGAPVGEGKEKTPAEDGVEACVEAMLAAAGEAINMAGLRREQLTGAGIGVPGVVLPAKGLVVEATNLTGWVNVPLRDIMSRRLGLRVELANDANAAALGEARFGAGRNVKNLVLFTLGTGIGGGIIINGDILVGANGMGGEIGHTLIEMSRPRPCGCERFGCVEAYAGALGIVKRAHEALAEDWRKHSALHEVAEREKLEAHHVFDLAWDGDFLAKEIVAKTAHALAAGITNILHTLDPELVLLAGGITKAGPRFLEQVRSMVGEMALRQVRDTRVEYALLGDKAGVTGAAAMVLAA